MQWYRSSYSKLEMQYFCLVLLQICQTVAFCFLFFGKTVSITNKVHESYTGTTVVLCDWFSSSLQTQLEHSLLKSLFTQATVVASLGICRVCKRLQWQHKHCTNCISSSKQDQRRAIKSFLDSFMTLTVVQHCSEPSDSATCQVSPPPVNAMRCTVAR